jgi:hypothetical protein
MRPQYDTEQLILTVKRACSVPTSQLTYTDYDWSQLLNDMLQTVVVPLMMSAREDYFVTHETVLSPADGIIPFPANAVGSKLRNVCYVSQTNPLILLNLPRIDLDVVAGVGFYNYATLAGFYIQGENLCLYPNTSVPTNTNIRLYYYKRTLVLAEPEEYGRVLSVDSGTNTVVLDFVPASWEIGTELNAVGSQPNFSISNELMTISALSSPSVVLDSVEGIAEGDFISGVGYSAVPQVPIEAHNWLCQLTAAKALEGLGDREGAKAAMEDADKLKEALLVMVSQRVDGSVKKVIDPNGGLRRGSGVWRRGLGGW